jgi:hypothetical protein
MPRCTRYCWEWGWWVYGRVERRRTMEHRSHINGASDGLEMEFSSSAARRRHRGLTWQSCACRCCGRRVNSAYMAAAEEAVVAMVVCLLSSWD